MGETSKDEEIRDLKDRLLKTRRVAIEIFKECERHKIPISADLERRLLELNLINLANEEDYLEDLEKNRLDEFSKETPKVWATDSNLVSPSDQKEKSESREENLEGFFLHLVFFEKFFDFLLNFCIQFFILFFCI